VEDLAATRRTIFGLQDPAINPERYQMFPSAQHAEHGKPTKISQYFQGKYVE
jgi:hypothetical protein